MPPSIGWSNIFGWTELIYGHLTARVPGPEFHFLINPFGLNYDEVTASNLVKIDLEGNVIGESNYPVNYAGFVIHSAVHMGNQAAHKCVMHTHSRAGMAVAALKDGLQQISMASTCFFEALGYHDYEGVSVHLDERERLLQSLGGATAMILRNHGLLSVGRTVPEAFGRLYRLERACQVQLDAAAAGTLNILPDDVAARSKRDLDTFRGTPTRGRRLRAGVRGAHAQARQHRSVLPRLRAESVRRRLPSFRRGRRRWRRVTH